MDTECKSHSDETGLAPPLEDSLKVLDTPKVKSMVMKTIPVQVPIVNSSNPQVPLSLAVSVPAPVLVSTPRLSPVPMNKKVIWTPVEKDSIRDSSPPEPHVLPAHLPTFVPVSTVLVQPNSQKAATPKDPFSAAVPVSVSTLSPTTSVGSGCVPNQASLHSLTSNTTPPPPANMAYTPDRGVPFYLPLHQSAVPTTAPSPLSVHVPDTASAQGPAAVPASSPSSGLPPPLHPSSAAMSSSAQRSSVVGPSIWSMVHTDARQPSSLQVVKTPISTVWGPQYSQFTVSETVN